MGNTSENSSKKTLSWNKDLSVIISEQDWEKACRKVHTMSINSRLRVLQFKWLMRIYTTPVKQISITEIYQTFSQNVA